MRSFRRFTVAAALLGAAMCVFAQETPPPAVDRTLEWAQEITLRPAIGGTRSGTRRWMRPPTLSVMNASTPQAMLVAEAVKQLNETLEKTKLKNVILGAPDNVKADILVYIAPLEKIPDLGNRHNLEFNQLQPVISYGQANQKFELQRGFVFLASDKVEGDALRSKALWAILGTLGFQQNSKVFPDSLFAGGSETLSDLDRKLVVFFYNHVPAMTEDRELAKIFKQHWPK